MIVHSSSHHFRCASARHVAAAVRSTLDGRAFVSEPHEGWVSLWDERCCASEPGETPRVAAEISRRLHAACLSFRVEADGTSRYWLHEAGELIDHYDSRFAGVRDAGTPVGDAGKLAELALQGTDPNDLRDVLDAQPAREQDRVEALAELLGIEASRASLSFETLSERGEEPEGQGEGEESEEPAAEAPEEPLPPLHEAARAGDGAAAALLLQEGAPPDGLDASGRTALHLAARSLSRDYEELDPLARREWWRRNSEARVAAAEREEDPARAWERERRRALPHSERARGGFTVDLLLGAGAAADPLDAAGRRPLAVAAEEGHAVVVKALLAAGAEASSADHEGRTALHAAAEWGWDEIVAELLAGGAEPDPADSWGWTPLMLAAEGGYGATVRALLDAGADPRRENAAGRTAAGVANDARRAALAGLLREL